MEMGQTLMEAGFDVSCKDVWTKIENLTKKYRLLIFVAKND